MFCLLKPLSIICLCSCLLRAMYIDVYPMLRMSAWGAMATEPWRSKKHNLHRHLETTCSTCSTCSNVDGIGRTSAPVVLWSLGPGFHLFLGLETTTALVCFASRHRPILKQPCVHCTWNHFWPERDDVQKFKHRRRAGSNFHREWLHLVHSNEKVIVIWR
jgi:hypothetical protein